MKAYAVTLHDNKTHISLNRALVLIKNRKALHHDPAKLHYKAT